MFEQVLAITRNTFFESIRQPIVLVLVVVATLMLIVANLTSTFTMADDQKMLQGVGLATVFLFGMLLAAFIATNVLTREIENRTVLTVVSKPVGRPLFVVSKYFGVALAILVTSLYMCFVFLLVERHGVMQTVRHPYHYPVIVFGFGAGLIALVASIWCNYFYGRVFASTMICTLTPLAGLAYALSLLFKPDFSFDSLAESFDVNLWKAMIALIMANLVLTAFAVALSTRLGQILTIVATGIVFLLGMLSDWLFGGKILRPLEATWLARARAAGETTTVSVTQIVEKTNGQRLEVVNDVEQATRDLTSYADGTEWIIYALGKIGHSLVPDFQVLSLADAVTQDHVIPGSYVLKALLYGVLCIVVALSLAVVLFQGREVG